MHVSIGSSKWEQVQTGIILATTSIVRLAEEKIDDVMDFLVAARLKQNCLEIFFSTSHLKTVTYAIKNMKSPSPSFFSLLKIEVFIIDEMLSSDMLHNIKRYNIVKVMRG